MPYEQPAAGLQLSEREKYAGVDAFSAGLLDGVVKANHLVYMWPVVTRLRAQEAETARQDKEAGVAEQIREQRKQQAAG